MTRVSRGGNGSDPGQQIILPLEATSSGQAEAWPFFIVAAAFGWIRPVTFYLEEPEAHLHPRAQVAVLEMVADLVAEGCRFVITTHSPFVLQKINNLLQVSLSQSGREAAGLDPQKVAAYQLTRDGRVRDLIDREETGLIDAEELEQVSEQLGAEFEALL